MADRTAAGFVGRRVRRREDDRLVRGHGRFVGDLVDGRTSHAVFVRSTEAAGRIVSIDVTAARDVDGVLAVITAEDVAALQPLSVLHTPHPHFAEEMSFRQSFAPLPLLAGDRVCYVGQPVAVVVAQDRARAEDAAELVRVEYAPASSVVDARDALLDGAPLVHPGLTDNVGAELAGGFGDVDAMMTEAAHVVHRAFRLGRHGAVPLETRGVLAEPNPATGQLEVWTSTQIPHLVAAAIRRSTGWSSSELRVVTPDVGGGFGSKANIYPEEVIVPVLARELSLRIAWIEDRAEHFQATAQGRDQYLDARLAVDGEGRILAWELDYLVNIGAGSLWSAGILANTALHALGPYRVPAYRVRGRAVYTNKCVVAQYRGAGRPEACFALERSLDLAADELGITRVEIRRRNILTAADLPWQVALPYRDGVPITYDATDFAQCLEVAAGSLAASAERLAQEHPELLVGSGMATYVEATGRGPYETARVVLNPDGTFQVSAGSASAGQSHETTFAQVAADALGVDIEGVRVRNGDTGVLAAGIGTFASRSAVVGGTAVDLACRKLVGRAADLVARVAGVSRDLVDVDSHGFTCAGRTFTWTDLASMMSPGGELEDVGLLAEDAVWSPPTVTWTMGAHGVVVGVEPDTGRTRALDYVVAHEGGREINPDVVLGQVRGGVAQGLGGALLEDFAYSPDGQPQTATFAQYLVPTFEDVPRIEVHHLPGSADLNPLGLKGVGESGTIPVYAAVASAVEAALGPGCGEILSTPVTPATVLAMTDRRSPHPTGLPRVLASDAEAHA